MSRAHPHGFPDDTPEPLAQPYAGACALIDLVLRWIRVAAFCAAVAGFLAFFFPSLFTLFR